MTQNGSAISDDRLPPTGGAGGPAMALRFWRATRPQFLTASVLPVLVGTAWGSAVSGRFEAASALFFLVGMVFGHAAGNVLNDVCDDISGNDALNEDRISPFTGGSRTIQDALLTRRTMGRFAFFLLVGCAATALYLVPAHGVTVLFFGLGMAALLLAYHLPPLKLNHRGLPELLVGLAFGILPVGMAAWLQGAPLDAGVVLVGLPVSFWIANVLLINEVPDRDADARVAKRTLVVLLGARAALLVHAGITVTALAVIAWASMTLAILPWWSLTLPGLLSLPALVTIIQADPMDRSRLTRAIKATLTLHAGGSLWLAVAALAG